MEYQSFLPALFFSLFPCRGFKTHSQQKQSEKAVREITENRNANFPYGPKDEKEPKQYRN